MYKGFIWFLISVFFSFQISAADTVHRTDKVKIGQAASGSDKILEADIGSGATNPKLQFDTATSKWQFTNDGSNFKEIGASGGLVAENLVLNPGFEEDKTNWTSSGTPTTYDVVTTAANVGWGTKAIQYDPDADGEYLESDAITIPAGLYSQNGVACIRYKGADSSIELNIIDGSSNELVSEAFTASTGYSSKCVNFIFPSSGTVKLRLEAEGDAADGYYDDAIITDANRVNISKVSSATFYGSVTSAATANCYWQTTGSFADFSADADCPVPSLTGNALAPATKIPGIRFTNLPPGNYRFVASGSFVAYEASGTSTGGAFRFYDGTSYSPVQILRNDGPTNAYLSVPVLEGRLTYTTTQSDITIRLVARLDTGDLMGVRSEASDFSIAVYRYPLESETVFSPSSDTRHASVSIAQNAAHTVDGTTATTWTTFTDTDIIAGDKTNYGKAENTSTVGDFGIKVSNLKAGSYIVLVNGNFIAYDATDDATETQCSFRIYDGANGGGTVRAIAQDRETDPTYDGISSIGGFFNYTSVQASKEFVVQYYKASGSSCYASLNNATDLFTMTVIPLDNLITQPQILNQVSSTASGGVRVATAFITNTGTPTVSREDGSWIDSLTDNGAGNTIIEVTSGIFNGGTPNCWCAILDTNESGTCKIPPLTSNRINVITEATDGTDTDIDFSVICIGAK